MQNITYNIKENDLESISKNEEENIIENGLESIAKNEEENIIENNLECISKNEEENIIENNLENISNNSFINSLTLELMVNKKHFKKVLEITDSTKFQEMNKLSILTKNASPTILSMTDELLGIYTKFGTAENYSNDVKNSFENYLHACLNHISMTQINETEQDNVLFGNCDEPSNYIPTNTPNFWGQPINKSM
jgi:hypothetical protein